MRDDMGSLVVIRVIFSFFSKKKEQIEADLQEVIKIRKYSNSINQMTELVN